MPTFEACAAGYRNLWRQMKVTRTAECDKAARKILAGRSHYGAVEKKTGVPWFWIGIIHMRESNNNFAGVLHNGEHIIGTGRQTRLVPAGRGPFRSWDEAADDALKLKGLHHIKTWPIERIGYEAERFNGWGYMGRHNSPYLWAGSNLYARGKYVADGRYDPNHVDTQLGVMPVLATLCKLSSDVNVRVNGKPKPTAEVITTVGTGGVVVNTGVDQGWPVGWIMFGLFIAVALGVAIYVLRRSRKDPTDIPPITTDPTIPHERGGAATQES